MFSLWHDSINGIIWTLSVASIRQLYTFYSNAVFWWLVRQQWWIFSAAELSILFCGLTLTLLTTSTEDPLNMAAVILLVFKLTTS